MLHEKVAFGAKRERRDRRVCPKESLIVGVVCDAVVPRRVVVHETEVVGLSARDAFDEVAEGVEAGRDRTRRARVSRLRDRRLSLGVD